MNRRRPKLEGRLEFRVNYRFNSALQEFCETNAVRFGGANGLQLARQHLFERGLRYVAKDGKGNEATRALAARKEFLDPKSKSISVVLSGHDVETFDIVCKGVLGLASRNDSASVILKLGYDQEVG